MHRASGAEVADLDLDDRALRELADIISGRGYLDLTQDLRRLAELYSRFAPVLVADQKRYRAGDVQRAETLAAQIAQANAAPRPRSGFGSRHESRAARSRLPAGSRPRQGLREAPLAGHRRRELVFRIDAEVQADSRPTAHDRPGPSWPLRRLSR